MSERVHISKQSEDNPIDSTGVVFETSVEIARLVSLNIVGSESASYELDVSPDKETWFESEASYEGDDVRDTFELTDRYVRVRVSTAASAGSTADITVQGVR